MIGNKDLLITYLFLIQKICGFAMMGRLFVGVGRRRYTRSRISMMPEGPEVRSLVDSMNLAVGGCKWHLTGAEIISGRYTKTPPIGWDEVQSALPTIVKSVSCKGKFIYFEFDSLIIMNTLGLSGGWTLSPNSRHIRAALSLSHAATGTVRKLYFYDMRNYGTIKVTTSSDELKAKLESLGYCWLKDRPSFEDFLSVVRRTKSSRHLSVFLMDQSKLAGVGNYILSEVLYRCRVHPWALCGDIDESTWSDIYDTILKVIRSSYASQRPIVSRSADPTGIIPRYETGYWNENFLSDLSPDGDSGINLSFLDEQLYSGLELFAFQAYAQKVCPLGNQIVREEGPHKRSIHWVPSLQTRCRPASDDFRAKPKRSS